MLAAALIFADRASAGILISIDKSTQRMTVSVDGRVAHVWEVSTGRANFGTPTGVFKPQRMERTWFSAKYYNSPMPYSIFFYHGYAIHGSYEISRLGGPASHGCVRLHPQNAATLFSLVREYGPSATTIVVRGENPGSGATAGIRMDEGFGATPARRLMRRSNQADDVGWNDWGVRRW
jgi:lipoprotein-anchoring transpeptidase ErfK/SrfK